MNKQKISVIGLGKLGSPMAAVFAKKGYEVIGLDINRSFVDRINSGQAPVNEPQLQEFINQSNGRLQATTDYDRAITETDITFVILPTPSQQDGFFSNDFLLGAVKSIGEILARKTNWHLVVITSTTMPGSTGGVIKQALEKSSGKSVGRDIGLCYSPEFIALGCVIRNMLNPDFILIGESDSHAGDVLESVYVTCCDNSPAIKRMNITNAELTKISVNTYVTTKISYANMVSEYCDQLPDADVDVVMDAVGSDSRIGKKYLKAALGYGGPCFPRDNKAFAALGRELGANSDLAMATDKINNHQVERLFNKIQSACNPGEKIAVLGLSYKPDTDVIEESQGVLLVKRLVDAGYNVIAFDPEAMPNSQNVLPTSCIRANNLEEATAQVSVVVITTAWPEFAGKSAFHGKTEVHTIIDPWSLVEPSSLPDSIRLIRMGKST
ncbi:MAG: UDP-glucose 6-dehydrogenase [Proteobacteria bacterium]|nr:MAG: UDP-glucose 6-dehydrogenase [Pseudomonadota bacterium]